MDADGRESKGGHQPPEPKLGRELAQHVVQNAAIHEIFDFIGGIDAAQRLEGEAGAILAGDL
ncbi:MAG: hypothetical protein RL764_2028, partial [Pseudomonadota bacterium]